MLPSLSQFARVRPLLIAAALVGAIVGCQQDLSSGMACPSLCPQQADSLHDTTIFALDFDTSVVGYPTLGSENQFELTTGKTFDLRAIVRFDTLQATFTHKGTGVDSDLVSVASAVMKMVIAKADTLGPPVTFSLYDVEVDSTENDTSAAALTPRFIPANLIGQRTVPADSLKDSIAVPLDTAKLLAKVHVLPFGRMRVGVQISAPQPTEVQIFSANSGFAPFMFIRPSLDTSVDSISIGPSSKTPTDDALTASELADFQLLSVATPAPASDVIRVGGIPGRRAYLRFNIPTRILDSSAVIRASLILTQKPNPGAPDAADTAGVVPYELASGTALTDLRRILIFLSFGMDSVGTAPKDSGERSFEIISALRRWRFTRPERTPRTLALSATREGEGAWEVDFFSERAAPAVRPRLHISYLPLPKGGLP
ncbi:MAG TPA: hypothetical protein VF483_08705 [Gemmatimonadaceae bacterium]